MTDLFSACIYITYRPRAAFVYSLVINAHFYRSERAYMYANYDIEQSARRRDYAASSTRPSSITKENSSI